MKVDFTKEELELIRRAMLEYQADLAKVSFAFEGELKDVTLFLDKIKSILELNQS